MHISQVRDIVKPHLKDMKTLLEYERVYRIVIGTSMEEGMFNRTMMYWQSYLIVTEELIKRKHCE